MLTGDVTIESIMAIHKHLRLSKTGTAERFLHHYFFDPSNPDDPRTNQWGKYPRLTYGTTYNNRIQSDWNEYKGDYFKLKNIQIGYTLPQRISSKFFVNKLRAFVSMDNILTITSYPGLDPEIGTAIGYPLMRQISFGGQITF